MGIWDAIEPHFMEILGTVLTAVFSIAAFYIRRFTGVEIGKRHREALHEAIMSGVESALQEGFETGTGTFMAHVNAHVRQSVPDALDHLMPGDGIMKNLIERYARQAINRLFPQEVR